MERGQIFVDRRRETLSASMSAHYVVAMYGLEMELRIEQTIREKC